MQPSVLFLVSYTSPHFVHFLHRYGGMCCTSSRHSGKLDKGSKLLVSLATLPRLMCLQDKLLSETLGAVPRDNTWEVKAFTPGWMNRKQAIDNLESERRSATSLRAKL